jgi:hypothetical protein
MKNTIIIVLLLFSITISFAQNTKNGFRFHSIALGFGSFSAQKGGGIGATINVTTCLNKNLFSIEYSGGQELNLFGAEQIFGFDVIDLVYGRELKVFNWLAFEGFAGLGYCSIHGNEYDVTGKSIAIPLILNTKFYYGKHFGMGFNTNYSINKINNIFTTNLIFHYKF